MIWVVVIFALVFACYGPALRGELLWDDAAHVTKPELRSLDGLRRVWTDPQAAQQYYPVLHTAFWVEYRLWGEDTLGYHLLNVVLHSAACVLLALVVGRLSRGSLAATARQPDEQAGTLSGWLAAILLAVHPVSVESVAWISEQKNTLSLGFYLAAALTYLKFDDARRGAEGVAAASQRTGGRAAWWYLMASACFMLALGAKSVTATLPAALWVALWWRDGALRSRHLLPLLPWLGIGIAAGLFTAWVEQTLIGARGSAFDLTWWQRGLLAGRIVWFYVGKLVWPSNLAFVYPRWDVAATGLAWSGYTIAAGLLTLVLWWGRTKTRMPLACWLIFVGSLFPALGFFNVYPFVFSYVADHFQYLATVGIFVGVGAVFARLWLRADGRWRLPVGGLITSVVFGLAVCSNLQSRDYRNGETLYRATLARNPSCWMAHANLGVELAADPQRLGEAIEHYQVALELKPDNAEAHNNLGNALLHLAGREREAGAHFETALRLQPRSVETHLNLATALARMPGRMADALAHCAEAVRMNPNAPEGHLCSANILALNAGREHDAITEYAEALRLRPDYAEAHAGLASVLARDPTRMDVAISEYESALKLAPQDAQTHYNFALLLENLPNRIAEAEVHYEEALRLDPSYAKAHNNLAILFAQRGDYELARKHWEAAVRIDPNYEEPRRNLALLAERTRK